MAVFYDTDDRPVEIAPGRGDLRYTSSPYNFHRGLTEIRRIGASPVSFAELFSSQPWVAAAVNRLLTLAIRVPLKLYRRLSDDERQRVMPGDHALARMISRPWLGPNSTQAALIQALLGPVLVHGNSVTEIEEIDGEPYFEPCDWRYLQPLGPESGMELRGWSYELPDGEIRVISTSGSVHVAWWSPNGPLGTSPLEQLGVTLAIEDAAQRYQQALFGNGARPPSAVTASEQFLTLERGDRQTLLDQLREDIDDLYSGPDRAGKPALLPPGLDWKPVGHTAVEAELISQRQVTREEVAAVYQIPPPMIGILDHATYSNIDVQKEMAYTMALGPPLALIEQTLTATLARDYFGEPDLYLEFDLGLVLRGDRLKEIQAFRDGIASGIYSPNEARRGLNMPADPSKLADHIYLPMNNLQPLIGDEPPPPKGQPPAQEAAATFEVLDRMPEREGEIGAFDPDQPRDNDGKWRKKGVGVKIDVSALPRGPVNALGDRPIKVGGDLDLAVKLLREGEPIELEQPVEVSTLISKLGDFAEAAKGKGEKAPTFDLCKVTVPGTNLFCHDSVGLPRVEMPQLKGDPVKGSPADALPRDRFGDVDVSPQFQKYLEDKGVTFEKKKLPAEELRATQNELNGAKVDALMDFADKGEFEPGSFIVSRDNYILDGHHRWAAQAGLDLRDNEPGDIQSDVVQADIGIGSLLFESLRFAEEMGIPQVGVSNPLKQKAAAVDVLERLPDRRVDGEVIPVYRARLSDD